jgi:hypothetical protein
VNQKDSEIRSIKKEAEQRIFNLEEQLSQVRRGKALNNGSF